MSLDLQKKSGSVQKSATEPAAHVQKKSLVQRESAKRGGFDLQMKELTPVDDAAIKKDKELHTVDAQDPAAMAKLEEAEKNAPAPKGVDTKVMAELETEYKAAMQPKVDHGKLGKVASKAMQLRKDATADQKKTIDAIMSAFTDSDPEAQRLTVGIN